MNFPKIFVVFASSPDIFTLKSWHLYEYFNTSLLTNLQSVVEICWRLHWILNLYVNCPSLQFISYCPPLNSYKDFSTPKNKICQNPFLLHILVIRGTKLQHFSFLGVAIMEKQRVCQLRGVKICLIWYLPV